MSDNPILNPYSTMGDEVDVFSAMGISGFGKATQKRQLDPSRFDRNKRLEVCGSCLHVDSIDRLTIENRGAFWARVRGRRAYRLPVSNEGNLQPRHRRASDEG